MKKNVIIHIGLHKTASTFLQTHVLPTFHNTTLLTRPFTQFNDGFNKLQYADDTLYNKEELQVTLDRINTPNIILSDENFSGKLYSFNCLNRTTIANRLYQLFPDATIVVVIRNQVDFIKSAYNHYVKGVYKGEKAIHKFIKYSSKTYDNYKLHQANATIDNYPDYLLYNTDDVSLNLEILKYTKIVELYKSLFPKVKILLFEDLKYNPKNFIHAFEEELSQKSEFDMNLFKKKENSSLSEAGLYAQIKLNASSSNSKLKKKLYQKYYELRKKTFLKLDEDFIKEYYRFDNLNLQKYLDNINLKTYSSSYFNSKN